MDVRVCFQPRADWKIHRGAIVELQREAQARLMLWESDHTVRTRVESSLDCHCIVRGVVTPRAPVSHGAQVGQQHHLGPGLLVPPRCAGPAPPSFCCSE